jgi:hypothetical protein
MGSPAQLQAKWFNSQQLSSNPQLNNNQKLSNNQQINSSQPKSNNQAKAKPTRITMQTTTMEILQAKTHPAMQELEVVSQKVLHSNEENEYH